MSAALHCTAGDHPARAHAPDPCHACGMPIFRHLRPTACRMPATLDKFLTALSGALALFGLLLIAVMPFSSPDDPHGGMHAAAFGVWGVLPTAAWLYLLVLSFRRRAVWRWGVLLFPAIALATVVVMGHGL